MGTRKRWDTYLLFLLCWNWTHLMITWKCIFTKNVLHGLSFGMKTNRPQRHWIRGLWRPPYSMKDWYHSHHHTRIIYNTQINALKNCNKLSGWDMAWWHGSYLCIWKEIQENESSNSQKLTCVDQQAWIRHVSLLLDLWVQAQGPAMWRHTNIWSNWRRLQLLQILVWRHSIYI